MAIKLNWYDNNAIEEGYRVYRSDAPMDIANLPVPLADVAANLREYRDETVVVGKTYYYRLAAFRNGQEVIGDEIAILADSLYLGPGSTEFVGGDYATAGFLGEVDTTTLISGDDLANEIGLTAGTSQYSDEPWLKFALDEKVLFVAKKPFRYGLSWENIADADAVYGEKIISIGEFLFRVRLLRGANTDPATDEIGFDIPITHGSEWNRLLYHVHDGNFNNNNNTLASEGITKGDWVQYSRLDLVFGSGESGGASWCQESVGTDHVHRGYRGISRYGSNTSSSAVHGWRPVLELLPENYMFPIELSAMFSRLKSPVLTSGMSVDQVKESIRPLDPRGKYDTFKAPVIVGASEVMA